MEFGIINLWNLIIVAAMLIPNIIHALKHKDERNKCDNKLINVLEQIGRYACIILMVIPLCFDKMEFGFSSVGAFFIYAGVNVILLVAYFVIWVRYSGEKSLWKAMCLAIMPTCMFLVTGITLEHWLLVVAAVIFGASHIYITYVNNK